jgi:hypothetical protein
VKKKFKACEKCYFVKRIHDMKNEIEELKNIDVCEYSIE